jgi:hypothetical protein
MRQGYAPPLGAAGVERRALPRPSTRAAFTGRWRPYAAFVDFDGLINGLAARRNGEEPWRGSTV